MAAVPGVSVAEILASVPVSPRDPPSVAQEPAIAAAAARPQLLLVSAATQPGLEQSSLELREFLAGNRADIRRVAQALQEGDGDLPYRRAIVCSGRDEALAALGEKKSSRVLSGHAEPTPHSTVFLLPGIGDHYVGMGHGLYAACEAFREEVDRCAWILQPLLQVDIRHVMYPAGESWKQAAQAKGVDLKRMLGRSADDAPDPDTIRLNTTFFSQPALFTIEYAMARYLTSLGVVPDAIIGHSMGEYVAACLAGVLSLEDALRLIAVRARLVNELPQAVMLAVMLPESELLPQLPADLTISLINGPSHCVVAGPPDSAGAFERALTERGVIVRRVQNGHAFHTRLMDPVVHAFEEEVRKTRLSPPRIPYISNVTGTWITESDALDPSYWVRHLTRTARFSEALHELWQLPAPVMVECGPGRTLTILANQHPQRKGPLRGAITSIRQRYENESDMAVLLGAIGRIWLTGTAIRWGELHGQASAAGSASAASSAAARDADESPPAPLPAQDNITFISDDAPANARERELLAIWSRALGRGEIGVNDSFGALGGDSLSSIAALLEMKRVGVSDAISRGLYRGLTIRQMVQEESAAGGATQSVTAVNGIPVAAVETPVFVRALGIYLVLASHFALTGFAGNPVLMVVSGLSFGKFQLRSIAKERNILPTFRFAWKIALPSLLDTMARQIGHHSFYPKSFLLMDNLMEAWPFGPHESPYYLDMLIQDLILASIPLAVPAIRRFAVDRPFVYGMVWFVLSWLASVLVPLFFDPQHVWHFVPQVYMWLLAMGWCAAYSGTRREKTILSVTFVCLNVISHVFGVGWDWYVVAAALTLVWLEEIPVQIPTLLVRAINAVAAASLFIYLTHYSFKYAVDWMWRHIPGRAPSELPALLIVPIAMAGGYLVWRIWEHGMRLVSVRLGFTKPPAPAPATGSW